MVFYEAHIKHTEETLTALAHMQYDLFCTGNRIGRTAVAAGLFVFGALNYTQWWGLLLIAYGSYLISSKYAAANRTAKKLAQQIRSPAESTPPPNIFLKRTACASLLFLIIQSSILSPIPRSSGLGLICITTISSARSSAGT